MNNPPRALTGLSSLQAEQLHQQGKGNIPPKSAGHSLGQIIFNNLFTWFNILNFILAAALIAVDSYRNMLFLGVVISNTLISTIQEVRARKTVERLTLLVAAPVTVMRDGQWAYLPSESLVEGDLVRFSAGDQVCADAMVLSGQGAANESLLTGESDPVQKGIDDHLYSGSIITEGRLYVRLTRVGSESYAGQLVQSVRHVKTSRSQLMNDLKKLIRFISYFLLPIGLILFAKQCWVLKEPIASAVPATVAAMLGMIPEGLMLLTSMTLAVGVIRLGQQNTLVQELYGIENLARVDTLCVDKTGTITKGCLQVEQVIPLEGYELAQVNSAMRQMLQSSEDDNATFQALRSHWGGGPVMAAEPVALKVPFSSARKWSAVAFTTLGSTLVGAPEFIMQGNMPDSLARQVEEYSSQGLRVLLVAHSPLFPQDNCLPGEITPQALILMNDQIREDFADTADFLTQEGVDIKILSGDNPRTVAEVARRAGLPNADSWVDASCLDSDEALSQAVARYTVFGRVAPDQKKTLVQALQAAGRTVAMVGDGVNDVPALKVCDCAIAMAGGSDAARKVSQLTLLKENFSALPQVILEGRRVINNITRSASLFLVKTCFSYLLSLLMLILPLAYPFHPIQMTLVSVFTVGIPSFFLAMEPNRERVKDGFLETILKNALPGALTNLALVMLTLFFSGILPISDEQRSSIAVIVIGGTGLLVLAYTSRPLTLLRGLLLLGMGLGMGLTMLIFGGFFFLAPLSGTSAVFCGVLLALSPVLLWLFHVALNAGFALFEAWKNHRLPGKLL
jgi:cation-transporting ATPase E